MMKELSIPRNLIWEPGHILFFRFEKEFIDNNIRCIPMIVRFKLDACSIKLKLEEWSAFTTIQRNRLVFFSCKTTEEKMQYRKMLQTMVLQKTGHTAASLPPQGLPAWAVTTTVFAPLAIKAAALKITILLHAWQALTNLQRFALVKLSAQTHESKNLHRALKEFGLTTEQ